MPVHAAIRGPPGRARLGLRAAPQWPELVTLVPPGTRVGLAGQVFFGAQPAESQSEATPSPLLAWLSDLVREALRLPARPAGRRRHAGRAGHQSLQAIALQYQILRATGADMTSRSCWAPDVARLAGIDRQQR